MADTTANAKDQQESPASDSNANGGGAGNNERSVNNQQPSGNPFPPHPGFPGFYGYAPPEGSGAADGTAPATAFFPFQSALYPYTGTNGPALFPVNIGQLGPAGMFLQRQKRRQVKNACVPCSLACKRCDNGRPCERCKKYGITESCVDSPRKERKKGVKRGPYKRRLKPGQVEEAEAAHGNGDAEWLENGDEPNDQPATVDPANLPNNQSSPQGNAAFPPPDGYYSYPYPYPYPPPVPQGDGQGGHEGVFPPHPHFFPHLHPYPPYPPWGQPPFDITGGPGGDAPASGGGSARTSAKKKKGAAHTKKASDDMKTQAVKKRDATATARANRAARRHGPGQETNGGMPDLSGIDMSEVTDPSLLGEQHQGNEEMSMSLEQEVNSS